MRRVRVTGPARRDIAKILERSGAGFGDQALRRYRRLFEQALQDLGDDAARAGVRSIDDKSNMIRNTPSEQLPITA
jgi:plasmid stabilization system protein ParE